MSSHHRAQSLPTRNILRPNHHNKPHSERRCSLRGSQAGQRLQLCPGRPARRENVSGTEGEKEKKKKASDERRVVRDDRGYRRRLDHLLRRTSSVLDWTDTSIQEVALQTVR